MTDNFIEEAARALYYAPFIRGGWESLDDAYKQVWRNQARALLPVFAKHMTSDKAVEDAAEALGISRNSVTSYMETGVPATSASPARQSKQWKAKIRMTDTPIRTAQEMMEDAIEALLRNAYSQGAEDVHREWSEYEGDFGEAADDYAKSVGIEAVLTALSDRIQPTTLPDPEAIALPTEGELVALIERTLDVHDDWNIPPSRSVARAILALMKGEG